MTATALHPEPPRATSDVRIRPAGTNDLELAYRLATADPLAWPRLYLAGPAGGPDQVAAITDRVTDALYGLDEEGRLTHANARAEEIIGRPEEAVLGEVVWDREFSATDASLSTS